MNSRRRRSLFALALTLALTVAAGTALAVCWSLGGVLSARAAAAGELHVCPVGCAYTSVQAAVDSASPGDVIKIAQGTYTDIHTRAGITQVVFISKTVTIRGGYTTTNWITPDPLDQATTFDAQGLGRVVVVSDTTGVTLGDMAITGGDATGLGGGPSGHDAGGGVYATGAPSLTVAGSDIYSNSAHMPQTCCGYGGGLYAAQCDHVVLDGNAVHHNWGNKGGHGYGGGLYLAYADYVIIRENAIDANVATRSNGRGGGLQLDGCQHAVLDGNVIRGNYASVGADAQGGGASLSGADHAFVTDNTFQGNVASKWNWGHGGGLHLCASNHVTLERNVFAGNSTSTNPNSKGYAGGGLLMEYSLSPTIINTVLADNYAGGRGSAVYVTDTSPRFMHTTVARNTGGDGSAIYVDSEYGTPCDVAFTNTIVFSHSVGITVTAGNTATLNGTLWDANGTDTGGSGTIHIGTVNVYGDPTFEVDGYHLTVDSFAIDAGVDSGVNTDLNGDPRPTGAGYDIGADEFLARIYLPLVVRDQ